MEPPKYKPKNNPAISPLRNPYSIEYNIPMIIPQGIPAAKNSFRYLFMSYLPPLTSLPFFILHSSFFILHYSLFILHSSLFTFHCSLLNCSLSPVPLGHWVTGPLAIHCPFLYKPQTSILYPSLLTIFPHFVLRTSYLVLRSMQLPPDRKILELIAALRCDNGLYPEVMREDQ